MSKPKNSFERMAQEAAARLDKVRGSGQQLALLPDEAGPDPVEAGTGKAGRPKGAMGKGSSQLRRWLAAQGYRLPEQQLAEIAGLASSEGAMLTAMAQAEQMLAWAFDGAKDKDGNPRQPEPEQRLQAFLQLYAMSLRSAEALLPYGTPKAAPEGDERAPITIVVPGAVAPDRGPEPRDVSPVRAEISHDMAPADVRHKMQQKQQVSTSGGDVSDGGKSDE